MRQGVIALCLLVLAVGLSGQDGRWKLGGDGSCYFDASDSGPNQCEPSRSTPGQQSAGRWKLGESDTCYFDSNDSGPDRPLRVQQVTRVAGNSEVTGRVTSMPTTAARISVNRRTRPRGSDDDRAGRWREHPARTVKGRTGVLPFRLYTASSVPDSVSAIGVLLTGRAS